MNRLFLYGLCAIMLLVGASGAGFARIDFRPGGGTTIPCDQSIFISKSWEGSGQDIDVASTLPTSLFSGDCLADHVNLYTQYGTLGHLDFAPQADSEGDAISKRGKPAAEPATMVLLGFGLIGLAGFARKKFVK